VVQRRTPLDPGEVHRDGRHRAGRDREQARGVEGLEPGEVGEPYQR
jgi:hypothetical protein